MFPLNTSLIVFIDQWQTTIFMLNTSIIVLIDQQLFGDRWD